MGAQVKVEHGCTVAAVGGNRCLRLVEDRALEGLAVVHIFRSPLGGLFRHVCDLVKGQAEKGIKVGLVCDSLTGDERSEEVLKALEAHCELGILRLPISRAVAPSDLMVAARTYRFLRGKGACILHGHGAKGGAIARTLAPLVKARSVYIPHGGALHFNEATFKGRIYLTLERLLRKATDGAVFESEYALREYEKKIGPLPCDPAVIYNGLKVEEFIDSPVEADAVDFMFMGELRELKGLTTLIDAAAELSKTHQFSLRIAGQGPDKSALLQRIDEAGLEGVVTVTDPVYPASAAFSKARCLVLPSLAESLPYMVLEVAAVKKPMITTCVGGIPEIFGSLKGRLVPPGDSAELLRSMKRFLDDEDRAKLEALELQALVAEKFSYEKMVDDVLRYYRKVLTAGE